jgi:Trk-type K+ transport system membrane component
VKSVAARYQHYIVHRYGVCLMLILSSIVVQIAAPDTEGGRVLVVVLYGLTLISAMRAADSPRVLVRIARVVVVVLILASAGLSLGTPDVGEHATRITTLILVVIAPVVIVRGLIRHGLEEGVVTVQTMFGVLCLYLLLGLAFASTYNVVGALEAAPFFVEGKNTTSNFLFFSFSTMTTTGYGNLIPAEGPGKALATLESLLGQVYLVTVVATIVGNLGRKTKIKARPKKRPAKSR